jgi:hypothetical protein
VQLIYENKFFTTRAIDSWNLIADNIKIAVESMAVQSFTMGAAAEALRPDGG